MVLLVATLTASQVIGLDTALPLVLGANIGSGLLAVLMTLKSAAEVRRVRWAICSSNWAAPCWRSRSFA